MAAEQCNTYKALLTYLLLPCCFLVPRPNNILSTSQSVIALPCQPTSHHRPPFRPAHFNNYMVSPPPPQCTNRQLGYIFYTLQSILLLPKLQIPLKQLPCANVHCVYLKVEWTAEYGAQVGVFCNKRQQV
jgi:hypothetical protein